MSSGDRIYVAGHRGLVGSALVRRLAKAGHDDLLLRTHDELDLRDRAAVEAFFESERPDQVYLAAAKVGGIVANASRPADFIRDNLLIQTHVIDAAHRHGSKKLLFLGSSCIYPREAPQPIQEAHLLTGPLEETNSAYALAKIAGIEMVQAYRRQHGFNGICLMPTNLYGPGDNFDLETSHVLPALLRKFHEAKLRGEASVTVWGTGSPRREFLHVDDLADACLFAMLHHDSAEILNVGVGEDLSITELARLIMEIVGFEGELVHDKSRPDGTPQKLLDVSRMKTLGWQAKIGLREGIASTYRWFRDHVA